MTNEKTNELADDFKIGHYRIISKIGKGGMGEVFLAQDTKLDRKVALKILPSEFAQDKDRMSRFVREAKSASALNHPNILTIYEINEFENTHFIATEFIDGNTLNQYAKDNRLNYKSALEIAVQVASALDEAHTAGIVHRDIKPDNIMVRSNGLVKILDFGIAKLTEKRTLEIESEDATAIQVGTTPGMIIGTANYMSPEQAKGKEVDARTDIFSFGVVLYEMMAGQNPFEGETALEMIGAILHKEPKPLNKTEVPPEIKKIIGKCLRKDRDERYQTIKDVFNDLKDVKQELEFQNKLERTVSPEKEKPKTQLLQAATIDEIHQTTTNETIIGKAKSNKLLVVGLAILLLSAIGFAYWFFNRSSKQIESIAVMPFVNESGSTDVEYLSDGMTETLISSLSQIPKLSVKARSSVFRYKGKETDAQTVGKELNVQAILNGRIVQRGDNLTLYLSLVDAQTGNQIWGEPYNRKMIDLVSLQSEIALDVSQKLKIKLSGVEQQKLTKNYTANTEAYQLYLKGLYYWNKFPSKEYEKSRDYFEQAIDVDPTYALAFSGLADYYAFRANSGLVVPDEYWLKAEAAANKALDLDASLGEAHSSLATVKMYYYRDWAGAERELKQAIELSPNNSETHQLYSIYLIAHGRFDEGLAEQKKALELEPLSLRLNRNLARAFYRMRDYDRAIEQYQKTLELVPNNAFTHRLLGDAYQEKGMQKEAVAEWSKALRLTGDTGAVTTLTDDKESAMLLERTFAASGFNAAVRAIWQRELEKLNEKTRRGEYFSAMEYVIAYTRLADKEQAFAWLAKAEQERNWLIFQAIRDPRYDSLRSDSRFQDLLRRVRLPQ